MDRLPFLGLILGLGALLGTQLLEGGDARALAQGPAAVIVFVGTLGATLLSSSGDSLAAAREAIAFAFRRATHGRDELPTRFRDLAFRARKDGLISLEQQIGRASSPFMARALRHVIDGCDDQQLREILGSDVEARHRRSIEAARVFETAGGYAPTMGILGAVLGLVRAMESLTEPDALGQGIAVAFIATIYGVGLANLVLLPIAARIRLRADDQREEDLMVVEGSLGLQAGLAPRMIERLLDAHRVESMPR